MMATKTKTPAEYEAEIRTVALQARAIADAAEKADRALTDAERDEITTHLKTVADLKAGMQLAKADEAMRSQLDGLGDLSVADFTDADENEVARRLKAANAGILGSGRRKTLGAAFTESDQFKRMLKQAAGKDGRFRSGQKVDSEPVQLKTLITGASDTSAGAFVISDNIGLQAGLDQFQRPLNVKGMFSQGTTASDTVEYVVITGTTNNAAAVAESTTTATPGSPSPSTGVKPESAMALAKRTALVHTFAHWVPATTRALSDAGQIRQLIDAFLTYGLAEELEDQLVNGDGTGENFDGVLHVSGTQTLDTTGMSMLQAIRRARTLVRVVGRSTATAYLMHPYDWERADLLVDNNGRFYFGGPAQLGTPNIWGLPVVESEAVPEGTIVCADWKKGVVWDREDSTIAVSGSHEDFFTRNMVAILAEDRYAFGIIQPNAFVKADIHLTTGYTA